METAEGLLEAFWGLGRPTPPACFHIFYMKPIRTMFMSYNPRGEDMSFQQFKQTHQFYLDKNSRPEIKKYLQSNMIGIFHEFPERIKDIAIKAIQPKATAQTNPPSYERTIGTVSGTRVPIKGR